MSRTTSTAFKPYAVAVLSVFVATVLTQLLQPFLASASFAFFYAAVAVSAWYGGIKPGLLAIALSTLAIDYFFLAPIHSIKVAELGDFLRLGVTTLVTLLIQDLRKSTFEPPSVGRSRLAPLPYFAFLRKSCNRLPDCRTEAY